jgi:hypothetical protein
MTLLFHDIAFPQHRFFHNIAIFMTKRLQGKSGVKEKMVSRKKWC